MKKTEFKVHTIYSDGDILQMEKVSTQKAAAHQPQCFRCHFCSLSGGDPLGKAQRGRTCLSVFVHVRKCAQRHSSYGAGNLYHRCFLHALSPQEQDHQISTRRCVKGELLFL